MSDERQIEEVVQKYYESLYESDAVKVREVFHGNAKITGYLHGELEEMSVDDFAGFVEAQQPSPRENDAEKFLEIISCEYAGDTACVLLRESYIGKMFMDTFSMLRVDGQWKIYNKLFHIEE
ncbi:MAG: nuclear transport factor 2 family protein [Planctomycetota bacterium]